MGKLTKGLQIKIVGDNDVEISRSWPRGGPQRSAQMLTEAVLSGAPRQRPGR
jgi:hypothetical protein